ncbi:MAG TPA: hypothetical protein VLG49_05310 [Rhabdochlamydiaceae bacterium]|nr:hypothetical protein [Rhabdochlamydiaceae bacterium]
MLFLLMLVFFTSCSQKTPWAVTHIKGNGPEFNSAKLTYHSNDKANGIDLEFLKTEDSLNLYLNVHSRPIPCSRNHPNMAQVTLQIEDKQYSFSAIRHQGGHRLLVPASIQEIIINSLKDAIPIAIHLEGYDATFDPAYFSEYFYKMHYPPRFSSHLNLSLL